MFKEYWWNHLRMSQIDHVDSLFSIDCSPSFKWFRFDSIRLVSSQISVRFLWRHVYKKQRTREKKVDLKINNRSILFISIIDRPNEMDTQGEKDHQGKKIDEDMKRTSWSQRKFDRFLIKIKILFAHRCVSAHTPLDQSRRTLTTRKKKND